MKPKRSTTAARRTAAPFLHRIESLPEKVARDAYPFNIRAFSDGIDLTLRNKVTFFVGENGSGTRDFLKSPERFFKHLFATVDERGGEG